MGLSPSGPTSPWAFDVPEAAAALAARHRESAGLDPSIHPSWLARALEEESPAVAATVAAHAPPGLARFLGAGRASTRPNGTPHPEVVDWVLTLWAERLVGGSPAADDPPVIVALTRLNPRAAYRLWRTVGIVKSALAREDEAPDWIRKRLGSPSPEVRAWARRDADAVSGAKLQGRRGVAMLGLFTAFRLLLEVEPHASRWAMQRLPYPIVRGVRAALPQASRRSASASKLEMIILKAGWGRAFELGRIALPPPWSGRHGSGNGD